jgi:hypothetical protein
MNDQDLVQRRGIAGLLFLAAPIVSIVVVGVAYLVLFWFGDAGREASGPLVRLRYEGCAEASPVLLRRVEWMGLVAQEVEQGEAGLAFTTRLPAEDRVRQRIPDTLARQGRFQLRPMHEGVVSEQVVVSEADLIAATVNMSFLDVPRARVELSPEAAERLAKHQHERPDDALAAFVEGTQVFVLSNRGPITDGQIVFEPFGESDLERLDFAAESAVTLNDRLPCPVRLVGADELGGGQ